VKVSKGFDSPPGQSIYNRITQKKGNIKMKDAIGMEIGWDVAAVMGGLLLFGIGYNAFVEWLERGGRDRGFTSLLVVAGVTVTLFGALIVIGWWSTLVLILCFLASGTPMIVGSLARYARERMEAEKVSRLNVVQWLQVDDGESS